MRFAVLFLVTLSAHADALQWSGFALLRGAHTTAGVPLDDDTVAAQVQIGFDWRPSMTLGGHVHLLARSEDDDSQRGRIGIVEAWLDQNLVRGEHRLRLMEGAFFLPGSRENVDALWESPYAISSSALNSWLGEEFRPIGVDAAYTLRRRWTLGGTVYRGNDTFGALPVDRGWKLHDHWTLLGERVRMSGENEDDHFTSVSAETDGRLGWSARGKWNSDRATVQLTHINNRSDARTYGVLENWFTVFDIAGADTTLGDWTLVAEYGWGYTDIVVENVGRFRSDIYAAYALVSRRLGNGRASLRVEQFENEKIRGRAVTGAFFWSPRGKLRTGIEATVTGGERRVALELRYHFDGR